MRASFVGSITRHLVKGVGSAGEAISRILGALVEGSGPTPQLIPVRVRETRRRS